MTLQTDASLRLAHRVGFKQRLRGFYGRVFVWALMGAVLISLASLATLLIVIFTDGLPQLNFSFFTSYDNSRPAMAGIYAALIGTIMVVGVAAVLTAPIGIATAIFLEEFAPQNWLTNIIQVNIANLAGVPSIIYGLLGFAVFVQILLDGQRGVIAGSLTLMLLVLPIVIITAQEAIKAVPDSHRYAAFAMGATRWQVAKTVVLPQAAGGIASGAILAYSRAIGEAAPIVVISSIITITFIPANLTDSFTVLPLTIFNWVKRPDPAFQDIASTAIIVLLALLLIMNSIAIWIRARSTRARE